MSLFDRLFETNQSTLAGRGIIIKEALTSQNVLKLFKSLETVSLSFIKETQIQVAFDPSKLDYLAGELKKVTKPSWFSSLWTDEKAIFIFNDKILTHYSPKESA